jgi:two-component system, cell cycle response regulator
MFNQEGAMRVLIADDDAEARQWLAALLRRCGYDPVTVQDGWAALVVLRGPDAPTLTVLDWMTPSLSDMEIVQEIRKATKGLHTHVFVLSGRASQQRMLPGVECGADDCLFNAADANELQVPLSMGKRVLALEKQLLTARQQLQAQATRDALTGLWNRALILEILDKELAGSRREGHLLSVILADLDNFQCINDTFGNGAGDEVLRQTARRLRAALRPSDAVGRYGGKKFLMVLPDFGAGQALLLAQLLRRGVAREPVMQDGVPIAVTLSLGVAGWDGKQRASELLRTAHGGLYQAKRAGRNHAVYSEGLSATI